jgi:hypothetical protein
MKLTLQLAFYSLLIYVESKFDLVCWFFGVEQDSRYRYLIAFCLFPLVLAAIPFLIAFAILLLVLSIVLVVWNAIAFSSIAHSGTFGSIEINGIRICGRVEKNNRLLLWEEIREVNIIFQPPFCSAEVILNSGESVMAFTEHSNNVELALEKYNIPFSRKQSGV